MESIICVLLAIIVMLGLFINLMLERTVELERENESLKTANEYLKLKK